MPDREAVLCSDCSQLFNTNEQVETDVPYSPRAYIPLPQGHRLHQLLWSTDLVLAASLANDCHFCSLLIRMRSRDNRVREKDPTSRSGKQTQEIYLNVFERTRDEGDGEKYSYHGIEIQTGKLSWITHDFSSSRLRLFKCTDSRISNMRELDQDSTTTSSEAAFATLEKWISMCEEKHHLCRPLMKTSMPEAQGWLPTRLVQINPQSVQIINTTERLLAPDSRYTTLSYCWGPPPVTFKRLLQASIGDMNKGFGVTALPKTFQDAIAATSRLGLNLIWIDALCIIQDSEEDWRIESMKMSQVYSQAYINLAAVASVDVHGGLFRERNPFSINPFDLKIKWPGFFEGSLCCVPEDPWIAAIRNSPLSSRAWTFQERLLSARTVYFAEDQLFWECGELCASEIYPLGGPFDPGLREKSFEHPSRLPDGIEVSDSGRIKDQYALLKSWGAAIDGPGFLEVWGTIVENYSKGRLTFPRDRLVAISGVAKQLSDHTTERNYFLGLWRPHLPLLLLWEDLGPEDASEDHQPLVSPRLGPSWSWSSHLNPVSYSMLFTFLTEPEICADVLDIDVAPGITPFTQDTPESGKLVIKAPMIKAKVATAIRRNLTGPLSRSFYMTSGGVFGRRAREWAPFYFENDVLLFIGQGMQTGYPCDIYIDSSLDLAADPDVFCVKLASADVAYPWGAPGGLNTDFGLILSHTGQKGQYKRVGCFAVAPSQLLRSWRADSWFWRLRFRSFKNLKERLFRAGDIESRFYRDFDGVGAYTIEIV
ncbi:hypothetical protein KVR01_000859 [Diaporthe batatas]|uniref:uncharacterized protein n=1 Tax=Diaporthe batatas TaxID=748121 RepID=UPI001D042030|nr:uncharacterized protein KVR01_000859 [Diaporthe batatas]KAG8170114.1 hypothetical protein KVR01_000859 [Diaporthe batatas]